MDRKVKKGSLWRRRGEALFILLSFLLLLLGLTPEKACANGYPTPEGYDPNDYQKLLAFLEYAEGGLKNGEKINSTGYSPAAPATWTGVEWSVGENKKVTKIIWEPKGLLGALDVSDFSSLEELKCSNNNLTSLNLSGCTALQVLNCALNNLTSLDVSECSALWVFYCNHNNLTSLDVSNCSSLMTLQCNDNNLISLNVKNNKSLQALSCQNNQLKSLDLSGCTALTALTCFSNQLISLDVSDCRNLKNLSCFYNQLSFSNLPVSLPVSEGTYTYSPQNPIPLDVGEKILPNMEIDLSAEAVIDGMRTGFDWYDQDGLLSPAPTPLRDGVFAFGPDFVGRTLYCIMTSTKFPGLELSTSQAQVVAPPTNPVISQNPEDATVLEGDKVTFNVEAKATDGGELKYQWQISPDGAENNWSNISVTNATLTITKVNPVNNGTYFRCQVTNFKDGFSSEPVYSKSAKLSVVARPSITSHPQDTTVTVGDTARFTVTATVADGCGELSYQWSYYNGKDWKEIEGATESQLTITKVPLGNNGYQYKCAVISTKDGYRNTVESKIVTLKVICLHRITFLKPTNDNDEDNPVNINSGSLVIATISGEDLSEVTNVTIKVDDGGEEILIPSGNTIYYLLPANLSKGEHTITIKLT
ncbi:MAG TPA: hypothetical protein GXZ98_00400, partial [Firmicutes bacterium]|nr:hypothetical protein [Bacillota bacterium]